MPASTSQRRTKPKVRRNSDVIETLDQDYLYGDDSSLILRAQADVLATSIYAYELDDERTSVKLTIEGDDTVLFEKDFEPSSGTVV